MRSVGNIKQTVGAFIVFLLVLILSCANQSDEEQGFAQLETGAASFTVNWYDSVTVQSTDTAAVSTQPANKSLAATRSEETVSITQTESDICEVVTEVSCEVYDASGNDLTSASFACSAHTGTVRNIPAGPNREFVILGVDAAGNILYQGRTTDTIISGQTRDLGQIEAHPFYVSTLLGPSDGAEVTEGFSLTWEPCENAAEYRVQVSDQIDFGTLIVNANTTGTSYQPTGLPVSNTYYWQVFPIDNHANQGSVSEEMWQFTLVEDAPSCTYGLSSPGTGFSAEGGSGSVTVTTSGGDCHWSVSSNADWLSITSAGSFTGSGTVTYTVPENTTDDPRTATLTITGDDYTATHSVTQEAAGISDVTPPTVTITSPTSGGSYSTSTGSLDISGTASDDVGITQVTWSNDRGGSGTCTGTTSWSASDITLYDGSNIITVTASDAAGNTASTTLTVTDSPDEPPTISFSSPTTGGSYDTSESPLSISGTAYDDVGIAQVTWKNDRGGSGTCTGTTTWSVSDIELYEGTNVITVTAYDTGGNTRRAILPVGYTPVAEPPTVTISTPNNNGTYSTQNGALSIGGSASDDEGVTRVTWTNDRGGSGTCTGTTSWSASDITLFSGENVITVTAENAAGGTGSGTLTVTYTPSETIPAVTITYPSDSIYTTFESTLSITGAASDDEGVTQVMWANNRGGSGTCTGTTSWSASGIELYEGVNVITVRAYDAANNTGLDSLTVTYTPPETIPTVTITYPTTESTYETAQATLSISGTASDDVGVVEVRWENDRGGSGICTGTDSWSVTSIQLYEGTNVITVRASDAAGNAGIDSLTVYYGQVVYFTDSNLEDAVRREIGKSTGDIYTFDLDGMTFLSAGGEGPAVSSLEGLQYCTSLTYLGLSMNDISDLSPLAGLTNLTALYLDYNDITDISALNGLTNLATLSLAYNQIGNISALNGLTNLTDLDLSINLISDINVLNGLTSLTDLNLAYNDINDIGALSGLINLVTLILYSNGIGDITPLVNNSGMNSGDFLNLRLNPLDETSCYQLIPVLQERGVTVQDDCSQG